MPSRIETHEAWIAGVLEHALRTSGGQKVQHRHGSCTQPRELRRNVHAGPN